MDIAKVDIGTNLTAFPVWMEHGSDPLIFLFEKQKQPGFSI
jgi:hypothetical protein